MTDTGTGDSISVRLMRVPVTSMLCSLPGGVWFWLALGSPVRLTVSIGVVCCDVDGVAVVAGCVSCVPVGWAAPAAVAKMLATVSADALADSRKWRRFFIVWDPPG